MENDSHFKQKQQQYEQLAAQAFAALANMIIDVKKALLFAINQGSQGEQKRKHLEEQLKRLQTKFEEENTTLMSWPKNLLYKTKYSYAVHKQMLMPFGKWFWLEKVHYPLTAFRWCADKGYLIAMKWLVKEYGEKEYLPWIFFECCAEKKHLDMMGWLVEKYGGKEISLWSAFDLCIEKGYLEAMKRLVEKCGKDKFKSICQNHIKNKNKCKNKAIVKYLKENF